MSDRPKAVAFQFYPSNWMSSPKIQAMTMEQQGIFLNLLCLDWEGVGFVYDAELLARVLRVTPAALEAAWALVKDDFKEREGRMYHPRLEKQRAEHAALHARRVAGAQQTNEKRWGRGSPSDSPTDSPSGRSPTPTPSQQQLPRAHARGNDNGGPVSKRDGGLRLVKSIVLEKVVVGRPWCEHCLDGVLEAAEGSRRGVQRHAPGCPLR